MNNLIYKQTTKQKIQAWIVAIVGLTLWVATIATLLELGSN